MSLVFSLGSDMELLRAFSLLGLAVGCVILERC